jgi:hypothetical protein
MMTLKKRSIKRPLIAAAAAIAVAAALGPGVLAAPPALPEIMPSDAAAHKYTVTVDAPDGIAPGGEVIMIAVKGDGTQIPSELSADDIAYIDQATATDGSAQFKDFIPASSDSVVFIAGAGLSEPKPIGYITGWGVKGTIKVSSYDPKKDITATLYRAGTENIEATQTVGGASIGAGLSTVSFDFEGIPDGVYDLVVSKPGHVSCMITGIVVDGEDIDLSKHANPLISTITLAGGQLDNNQFINSADLSVLISAANYGKTAPAATNALTDIDGNGYVNSADLSILISMANYGKTAQTIAY